MTILDDFVMEMPDADKYDLFTRDGKWIGTVDRWFDTMSNEIVADIDVSKRAVMLSKSEWEL